MHIYNILKNKYFVSFQLLLKIVFIIVLLFGFYLLYKLVLYTLFPSNNIEVRYISNHYNISPEVPKNLTFAGEKVPLERFDVYESLDRELIINTYFHSQTILNLKRANRFFPIIEPILKKYNVPDDFKYLMVIESNLANTISPAGAVGYWQFMKPTAEKYGLEITDEIDERYHIVKSTEAACKYLLDLYSYYKNWTLVSAAYNAGPGLINKVIEQQKSYNYYDLQFNEETARYIYRILAMKIIMSDPQKYGFYLSPKVKYYKIPTKTIAVDSSITNLPDFANKLGINYKLLRIFNPWIRKYQLTNKEKKTYYIEIPEIEYTNINKLLELYSIDTTFTTNDTILH